LDATAVDGSEYQGRSTFTGHDTMVLKKWGCKILTVRLQGFIFFFTAERLRSDLIHMIQSPDRQLPSKKVEYLILDFRFVENFDSTSIQKLNKLFRTCEQDYEIKCMITNLQGDLKQRMEEVVGAEIRSMETDLEVLVNDSLASSFESDAKGTRPPHVAVQHTRSTISLNVDPFESAEDGHGDEHGHGHGDGDGDGDDHGHDHGHGHDDKVDWGSLLYLYDSDDAVEVALLGMLSQAKYNPKLVRKDDSCEKAGRWTLPCVVRGVVDYQKAGLGAMVAGQLFDTHQFRQLGETKTWQNGDIIQAQDEWSHRTLYYICSGQVATFRTHVDGSISKTELRHRGTVVGETGFFVDQPRYGSLRVVEDDTETVAFTLENYRELAKEHPAIAEYLHVYVVEMQTDCIKRQAHEINMLLRPAKGIEKHKSHALA
jgi:anti-anti-sigma regulatory factor